MSSIVSFINRPEGPLVLVGICLVIIIWAYFYNNPLRHGRRFMVRRFINWFPLGMTYAFLYMGRYNLNVSKNALGSLMTKEDFAIIFATGTWTYAISFLINGPLIDKKFGGKRGIMIAAVGAALANIFMGVLTYEVVMGRLRSNLVVAYSTLYALNMYFQSYGAVSIIKVKAYWFHVRERGVFGAIFGTLISFGAYFAFDWGRSIVEMSKANPTGTGSWLQSLIQNLFALKDHSADATWAVFFIPAAIMLFWAALDWWLIRDTPEEAGFRPLETCDASSGQMGVELTTLDLLKKVFTNPLLLVIAAIELTSGVFRNGIAQWYTIFATENKQPGADFFSNNFGLLICIFGIIGGFVGGLVSDKFFQSRRGPPAGWLCAFVLLMAGVMAASLFTQPVVTGWAAVLIWTAGVGVTSLMSGTAATDFGGRKATATCSGIVDGFAYLGSGLQALCIGFLIPSEAAAADQQLVPIFHFQRDWQWWPVFLMPFAIFGAIASLRIWKALPPATQRYIAEVESKGKTYGEDAPPEIAAN
jgi:OPA family glycerol-3-phosphate transporter-like MFS transporter